MTEIPVHGSVTGGSFPAQIYRTITEATDDGLGVESSASPMPMPSGAPFNRLDELEPGDAIEVRAPTGAFEYDVIAQPDGGGSRIVDPADLEPIAPSDRGLLTLVSYHPEFSARQCIVVQAEGQHPDRARFGDRSA